MNFPEFEKFLRLNQLLMTREFLYKFISKHKLAVLATISEDNKPESSLVGFAITPELQIIFDTLQTSRKSKNLFKNPAISFVIGWDSEQTVQYEGEAKIPIDSEIETLLSCYYKVFPEGTERRDKIKDLIYFCVKPVWIRYSDFNFPENIEEISFDGT